MKKIIILSLFISSFTFCFSQNVGIGITTPVARLHVSDSNVLFTGPVSLPFTTTYNPPASGAGSRMMWYPQKAAFRTGNVDGGQWDKDNIGRYSFATGVNTIAIGEGAFSSGNGSVASGEYSIAMGYQTTAGSYSTAMGFSTTSGNYSTAMGDGTIASGSSSTAMGIGAIASGNNSTAMGYFSTASGLYSTAMGRETIALGQSSTAMGSLTTASALNSTAMGVGTTASGNNSTAMGSNSTASGSNSTAMGLLSIARSSSSLVIGRYNDTTATNRLFEIGNGSDPASRNNAMTVLTNGNVGIGTTNPTSPLQFANTFGTKISLFKGAYGDVGVGIYGGELRLQNDIPNGKVSLGVLETTGAFTELAKAERNGVYAFSIFGSLWVNGTTYASDERFKQNITAISSPLHKILQINGVEYEMKSNEFTKYSFQPKRQIGLLAQNVEKIVPEAVNEMDGYKGVDYARLVPLLIESIKELNKKVDQQQKQIEELKTKIK